MGFDAALWRGIAVFRVVSLCYAVALTGQNFTLLAWPGWTLVVVGAMVAWTAVATYAYASPARRRPPLLVADLVVGYACLLSTAVVAGERYLASGAPPLTSAWFASPVLAWVVVFGRRWAVILALAYAAAEVVLRGDIAAVVGDPPIVSGIVLIFVAGYAVGSMARFATEVEERFAQAVELEARTRERERLARSIHDSVLQVLAMVRRRGTEIGGEAAELGRMAGEQEIALRSLVSSEHGDPGAGGRTDLRAALQAFASGSVSVAAPATEVRLPRHAAEEITAAVRAALANVERHCPPGTRAWLLVEDEPDAVVVTVRDDGPGIPEDRVTAAAEEGRLGLAQSIIGRVRDLGGTVTLTSPPGEGTEIEMRVPR